MILQVVVEIGTENAFMSMGNPSKKVCSSGNPLQMEVLTLYHTGLILIYGRYLP